jgi:hypothetical protein
MKSLQLQRKTKRKHSMLLARHKDRGISSLIGITLFIIIFTLAIVYIFAWTLNTSNYANVVKSEIDYEQQRAAEMLQVMSVKQPSNQSLVFIANPTSHLIVVNQVWNSTHLIVWNENITIPSFSNYINLSLPSSDGIFKVVTLKGNIFFSTPQNQAIATAVSQSGHWDVKFWVGATNSSIPIILGNATWYELSFMRVYGESRSWGAQPSNQTFGFTASTLIQPQSSTNNISISVGLINNQPATSNITIFLKNSTYSYPPAYFASSGSWQVLNIDPSSNYYVEVDYVNNATKIYPQTVTVTIVGADFG